MGQQAPDEVGRFVLYNTGDLDCPHNVVGQVFAVDGSPPQCRIALSSGDVWEPSASRYEVARRAFLNALVHTGHNDDQAREAVQLESRTRAQLLTFTFDFSAFVVP